MAAGALASSWDFGARSDVTPASAVTPSAASTASAVSSSSSSTPSGSGSKGLDSLDAGPSEITIPSTGLDFFEYRRACFLAGRPVPVPPPSTRASLPETYTVPPPPAPAPAVPYSPAPNSSVGRLEALLADFGDRDNDGAVAWNGGVGNVHRSLTGGRRLAKGLRLGLVIKILKAGWLRDGTWPTDPGTALPYSVPDSPERTTRALEQLEPCSYPPVHEGRNPKPIRSDTIRGPSGPPPRAEPKTPLPAQTRPAHSNCPHTPLGASASSASSSSPQPTASQDTSRPRQILPIPIRGARAGPAMRHMEERA